MRVKLDTPLYIENGTDVLLPSRDQLGYDSQVFIACDDAIVAQALLSYIQDEFNLMKSVTDDAFNAALDAALNTEDHRVKRCNLALAIYNAGGCYVAQMGSSRVLQVRPDEQEIVYDSRSQVLDIYSSKAKVEQIEDLKPGDYLLLTTAEMIDYRAMKRILSKPDKTDEQKLSEIAESLKTAKTTANVTPAAVLNRIDEVSGRRKSVNISGAKVMKTLLYLVGAAVVAGGVYYLVTNNPFAGGGDNDGEAPIDTASMITDKAPNDVDLIVTKEQATEPTDTTNSELTPEEIEAKKQKEAAEKAKAEKEKAERNKRAESNIYDEIKVEPSHDAKPVQEPKPTETPKHEEPVITTAPAGN